MRALPILRPGASGGYVIRVQMLGNYLVGGENVKVDGEYGPATTALVKRVQRFGGLSQTGVVNGDVWAVLMGVH